MKKDTVIIYHDHCADGFGAAFAAWTVCGGRAAYEPMSYNQHPDVPAYLEGKYGPLENLDVHILDFSIPREQTNTLLEKCARFVWLDHHKTAFEMWHPTERNRILETGESHYILLDNDKSGALLAWEYYQSPANTPDLIKMIDDRDRWVFALSDSKALSAGLHMERSWSFSQWSALASGESSEALEKLIAKGAAILEYTTAQVNNVAEKAGPCTIIPGVIDAYESYKAPWVFNLRDQTVVNGLAINARENISELGHALAVKSGTFGMVWSYDAELDRVRVSLRSNGDYDVSAIAKVFGGGGHKNAGGFETTLAQIAQWVRPEGEES